MSIIHVAKNCARPVVDFLNDSSHKNQVKNCLGYTVFALGIFELITALPLQKDSSSSSKPKKSTLTMTKVANFTTKAAIVLSAGVSRPGIKLVSWVVGSVLSSERQVRIFGVNTIFAVNPWHPRHCVSIVAAILAASSLTVYAIQAAKNSMQKKHRVSISLFRVLVDIRTRLVFVLVTSRPILHIGNAVMRRTISTLHPV